MSDAIKRLADKVRNNVPKERASKANRTLYLKDPTFTRVRTYCLVQGMNISDVVDELLEQFAKELGETALDHAMAQFEARETKAPRTLSKATGGGSSDKS